MPTTTGPVAFHDSVHAVALARTRRRKARRYRWLALTLVAVAGVIAAVWRWR